MSIILQALKKIYIVKNHLFIDTVENSGKKTSST